MNKTKAPWRDTALDAWSTEVDPSILSGDQYTQEGDLRELQEQQQEAVNDLTKTAMQGRFQHPQHDTSMDRT